jgi:hypothetical protein
MRALGVAVGLRKLSVSPSRWSQNAVDTGTYLYRVVPRRHNYADA